MFNDPTYIKQPSLTYKTIKLTRQDVTIVTNKMSKASSRRHVVAVCDVAAMSGDVRQAAKRQWRRWRVNDFARPDFDVTLLSLGAVVVVTARPLAAPPVDVAPKFAGTVLEQYMVKKRCGWIAQQATSVGLIDVTFLMKIVIKIIYHCNQIFVITSILESWYRYSAWFWSRSNESLQWTTASFDSLPEGSG